MIRRLALPAAIALAMHSSTVRADNPAEAMELGRIDVVGTTPLPGLGTPLANVPANVQIFSGRDMSRQKPIALPDFLERNAASVVINSGQGNPFQPDIVYRGFIASPLLGSPQGMSVFQDGVRINEAFGDVVNWDLLPSSAIASIQLVPGSSAAFGPNTLGGSLAIYTKSGSQFPGGSIEAYGGSFHRGAFTFEQGGAAGPWDYYLTANALNDHGWAQHNPSRLRQAFAKVGYQTDTTDLDVTFTGADNTLEGVQLLPHSFFDDIRQAYTFPDRNTNRLGFVSAKGSVFLSREVLLGGTAYYRKFRNENVSSNVNDNFGEELPGGGTDELQATNDRAVVDTKGYGFGAQLSFSQRLWGHESTFALGASADFSDSTFTQNSQPAAFTADRGTVGIGDFETETDAATRNRYYGVYFSESFQLNEQWTLTLAGRQNIARVDISDRSGLDPALEGSHRFSRFSPAAGINFNPTQRLTMYAAYTRSMRAPTAAELTCADPDAPCKFPNAFLADPPLNPIIAATTEIGARGKIGEKGSWSAAIYRTDLDDDIQFVASGGASAITGFFRNVGKTRRQGLELAATTRLGSLALDARYSFVDATFRSSFSEPSPNNSAADDDGSIAVRSGNRIPGVPRQSLKVRVAWEPMENLSVGGSVVASSSIYARGDENNRDVNGRIPGWALFGLDARWRFAKRAEIFARIDNVFDIRYSNTGAVGRNFFNGPGRTFDPDSAAPEQFRGPGAPRGAWAGIRFEWL